jgi:hypothetical protein
MLTDSDCPRALHELVHRKSGTLRGPTEEKAEFQMGGYAAGRCRRFSGPLGHEGLPSPRVYLTSRS